MNKEEFTNSFKVGDKITSTYYPSRQYLIIKYIGKNSFFAEDYEDEDEEILYFDNDWKHYKEPVKKDLEGVKTFYRVQKDRNGVRVHLVSVDNQMLECLKQLYPQNNYITEQEAIDRGLSI